MNIIVKTWYEKYNGTKLMFEFKEWLHNLQDFETWSELKLNTFLKFTSIKMWWGYLICFAETKGYGITLDIQSDVTSPSAQIMIIISVIGDETSIITQGFESDKTEQAMNWCAEKFFEVAK